MVQSILVKSTPNSPIELNKFSSGAVYYLIIPIKTAFYLFSIPVSVKETRDKGKSKLTIVQPSLGRKVSTNFPFVSGCF